MSETEYKFDAPVGTVFGGEGIDEDYVRFALDALPVGSAIQSSAEAIADGECRFWSREVDFMGALVWRGTGSLLAKSSEFLAKRCAPLTVIR
ncbi:hypothetical protein CH304_00330 [Rhodococcus sp. 15-649-1-2]|nr:hypothetical protein [Rhodococcus sp. 15-649-1-2]OZE88051.1 hypothetical protein CH304_00330 [Rhodococcus sp. 15-649-1-2]